MQHPSFSLPGSLIGLFSDEVQLDRFISYLKLTYVTVDQFLFRKGEPSNGIYFIASGQMSSILESPNGKSKRLRSFGTGEIIGEAECYCNVPRLVSLLADRPSALYHLSSCAWERMERKDEAIATEFHNYLLGMLALRFNIDNLLAQ